MSKVPASVQKELGALVPEIITGLGTLLGETVEIDLESMRLDKASQFIERSGGSGFCCRSQYMLSSCGIGGMFLQDRAVQMISALAMFMDVPSAEMPLDEAEAREALDEVFNVYLGTWNRIASTDFRMSTKINERAVERYSGIEQFPNTAGIFPLLLVLDLAIGEECFEMAIFLPPKYGSHLNREPFEIPDSFVVCTTTGSSDGTTGLAEASSEQSTAPADTRTARSPVRLVIIDDEQLFSQLLRERTASGDWELIRDAELEPEPNGSGCVLVFGDAEALLEDATPSAVVRLNRSTQTK